MGVNNPGPSPATTTPSPMGVAGAGSSALYARADHTHSGIGQNMLLWSLAGANMNTTADQALAQTFAFTNHIIDRILVLNASLSLTLAAGGFYTAASKGGTAIVAAGQVYTALTAATKILPCTIANTDLRTNTTMFFALTTGQGGAATADIYVFGYALT